MNGLFNLCQGDQMLLSEKRLTDQKVKLNCWEFKKCGREPGGTNASQRETCPACVAENQVEQMLPSEKPVQQPLSRGQMVFIMG